MITKNHIDTLSVAKFNLIKSIIFLESEENSEVMTTSIRNEIESLAELANDSICIERCHFFQLDGVNFEDYRERILYLDEVNFILAGIRFHGLDINKPFVDVLPSTFDLNEELIKKISMLVSKEFSIFKPLSFQLKLPRHFKLLNENIMVDRYTVVGKIDELVNISLNPKKEKIELIPLNLSQFYDEYLQEYQIFHELVPHLRLDVKPNMLDNFKESVENDLGFQIFIDGVCAGVIAALPSHYYGLSGAYVMEEILFSNFRGKGFGSYIQKEFAKKLIGKHSVLWGTISEFNPPSLKAALKNGREISEVEIRIKLDLIEVREAKNNELDPIYLMGHDCWSDGLGELEYLKLCQDSLKYKKGTWYVLTNQNRPISSLIIYKLDEFTFGIGSIATDNNFRKKGFGTIIINRMIEMLESDFKAKNLILFSDINPDFYTRFGFVSLPQSVQPYRSTICMVRSLEFENFLNGKNKIPEYF